MAVLHTASDVKAVADTAEYDSTIIALAKNINNAANTGSKRISWPNKLSDKVKSTLESNGYKVIQDNTAADPKMYYLISWE